MSFGQTRPKWRHLVIMHSTMFGEDKTQHIKPVVKHGGGGLMIWAFAATGPGHLESTRNSSVS